MDYDLKLKENIKRNEKFIDEFEKWLIEKKLSDKTINKHLNNIDLYINNYLNYYDFVKMENGIKDVYSFLGDWFIEKCAWSSRTSLKDTAASIKKFYQCMCEKGHVSKDDYEFMCKMIKDNMDKFLDRVDEYNYELFNDY